MFFYCIAYKDSKSIGNIDKLNAMPISRNTGGRKHRGTNTGGRFFCVDLRVPIKISAGMKYMLTAW